MSEALASVGEQWFPSYCEVRSLTEMLAEPLSAEDQTVQSMPDVSPTKWHRAHTTWFFEEFVLAQQSPGHEPFHPAYRYLFNSYYEAVGDRHPRGARGVVSRPGIDEIAQYRQFVDEAMHELSCRGDGDGDGLIELGLHHEQQHQELLLMDIKHVLSHNVLDPVYRERIEGEDPTRHDATGAQPLSERRWVELGGGRVTVGADADRFAYDNERPRHDVLVQPFALADRAVTCGEWMAFIADAGYERAELWLSDGWAAVTAEGWDAPLYWRNEQSSQASPGWSVFTLAGRRPVDPAEPVCHISYYEADAFARWAGARLPTEAEWELALDTRGPTDDAHCLDLDVLHPRHAPADGASALTLGGVWEWTSSPYTPYPGFAPAAGAVGEYNGKFMVNQQVLRGGSCATPRGHWRPTYRNFFPPGARWAFSGLRLAADGEPATGTYLTAANLASGGA